MSMHAVTSHLMPMVPLGWALRAAGHEVLVALPPNLCADAHAAGLNTVPVGPDFDDTQFLRDRLPDGELPIDAWDRPDDDFWSIIAFTHIRLMRGSIDDYLTVARQWRPQLLIADPMEHSARLAAGALDLPLALHRWGIDPLTTGYQHTLRSRTGSDCRRLGLDAFPEPDLLIDPCPPSLQIPGIPAGRPMRYEPYNGTGSMPAWALADRGRPRVAVSLGTHVPHLNGEKLVARVAEALAGLPDVEVVLALPSCEPAVRELLGDQLVHAGPLPLNLILGGCDAVVFHGGTGTALTSARLGVPQLVLPQFSDQFPYAERVAAVGNGVVIDTPDGQRDTDLIRESLRTLVESAGPKARARRLAEEADSMVPPARFVAELEQLAEAGRARPANETVTVPAVRKELP